MKNNLLIPLLLMFCVSCSSNNVSSQKPIIHINAPALDQPTVTELVPAKLLDALPYRTEPQPDETEECISISVYVYKNWSKEQQYAHLCRMTQSDPFFRYEINLINGNSVTVTEMGDMTQNECTKK